MSRPDLGCIAAHLQQSAHTTLSHHMVCIHAVAFCHAPLKLILVQRGKVPIVVGGTGLYLRWLVHGRPQTPKSEPWMAARAQEALEQVLTVPPCGICMS